MTVEETPDTTGIEEFKNGLKRVCKFSGINMCPGCGLTLEGLDIILHQQLQKARQDWLREEIVKLGETIPSVGIIAASRHSSEAREYCNGFTTVRQTIIDRYQKELDQDLTTNK